MSRTYRTTPFTLRVGVVVAVALLLATLFATSATAHGNRTREDILGQGGEGVARRNGALLLRNDYSLRVRWQMRTPEPGSYAYPDPDDAPPGLPPHPPIEPGRPEVFTLWAFVFNFPDECTDDCDFDDIGAEGAQGGIYQLDGTIARGELIRMVGKVRIGQMPAAGAPLVNPRGAEVHVAMAPHGMQRDARAELQRQLNGAVGGPPQWFPAIFAR